ncbi:MAG TPA: hypothetical protein VF926_03305 [Mycobacterium sp.]
MELSGIDPREGVATAHNSGEGVAVIGRAGPKLEIPVEAPAIRGAASEEAAGVTESAGHDPECAGWHRPEAVRAGREEEGRYDDRTRSHGGTFSDSAGVPQEEAHRES